MSLLITREEKDRAPAFANLFDDFFTRDWLDFPNGFKNRPVLPAVNILDNKDHFQLELAVPGMDKKDFKLKVENNLLTISSHKEEEKKVEEERYARREFSYQSFERTFTLPETVHADNIKANYHDGILSITLPKKEEAKVILKKEIKVS